MRSRKRLLLLALPAILVAVGLCVVALRTQRTLDQATRAAAEAGRIEFSLQPLDLAAASAHSAGFEPVEARQMFTCGAFARGELYLAGPGGLSIYGADGALRRALRTGIELPVQPIVAMAGGRLRGSAEEQLLLATAGAGLLLLERGAQGDLQVRQMRAATEAARDLTALLPLGSGDVLLGTRSTGVLLFDGHELRSLPLAVAGLDAGRLEVTALAALDATSYLIGTRTLGMILLRGGVAHQLDHRAEGAGLPDDQVESFAVAGGHVYVGTPLGVAELTPSASELRVNRVLARGVFGHALAVEEHGSELLVGTLDQGVLRVSLQAAASGRARIHAAEAVIASGQLESGSVSQFLRQPAAGQGTYAIVDGALQARTASGWTRVAAAAARNEGLTDRNISALAFDGGGNLYVGYFDRGLDIVGAGVGGAVRHLEDDHLFCVNRLVLDPERATMAAATANGLVLFARDGTPRQVLTRRDGLIADHVSDVVFSPRMTTVATPAGLTFLSDRGAESVYAFEGLVNNHVYALAGDAASDRVLAGTLGGLSVLEGGNVRRSLTAANSGLRHNWITALIELPDRSYLVGTYGAGIMRFSMDRDGTARFAPVDLPAGVPRDVVINPNAIFASSSRIYAGTLGYGMLVLHRSTGRWTNVTQGLPSLNVTAFAEREGKVYVGTANGLVRVAEDRLP